MSAVARRAQPAATAHGNANRVATQKFSGHQPCSTCRGGHTTRTCLACGAVVYGPPLAAECRILVGVAAVR
jgi:hypothetical protein